MTTEEKVIEMIRTERVLAKLEVLIEHYEG